MIAEYIAAGMEKMGISISHESLNNLQKYWDIVLQINPSMNLTRIVEDQEAASRHFLDAMVPLAHGWLPQGASLVDVGTGAGFPGMVLAIARPDLRVTLVDAQQKKCQFLRETAEKLGISVRVKHGRAEDLGKDPEYRAQFDVVCARAVAALPTLVELLLPLCAMGGQMLCYKGPSVEEELEQAKNAIRILGGKTKKLLAYDLPNVEFSGRLVVVDKVAPTPNMYPRKAGTPGKDPLK